MTIIYTFADGTTSIVEVSEEIGNVIIDFDRKENNADRRQRRHNCSLEAYNVGDDLVASDEDIAADFIEKQDREQLYEAIRSLLPEQQDLIVRVFFNKEKMCDIAKECGVTKMAISKRIDRALAQLKKILKNFS